MHAIHGTLPFGCNICQTHICSCARRYAALLRHGSRAPPAPAPPHHASVFRAYTPCPHTRGKSGCEHANSYCSARLTLTLTPTLTSTLTEPGPLTLPSPFETPIACVIVLPMNILLLLDPHCLLAQVNVDPHLVYINMPSRRAGRVSTSSCSRWGSPPTPIPCQSLASLVLRVLTYYNPGHEGSMALVVVCPRGIGCGPTLPR